MASCPHGEGNLNISAVTKPSFFRIILEDITQNNRLSLPKRFIREHGDRLSNTALLRVITGAEWKVDLVNCGGEVCIQNGWFEFAEFHSLKIGYFLVFEYEGDSKFSVVIIDKSACEVGYQVISCAHDVMVYQVGDFSLIKRQEIEDGGNCNVDGLDDFPSNPYAEVCGGSPLLCSSPGKMKYIWECSNHSSRLELVRSEGKVRPCSGQEFQGGGGMSAQETHSQTALLMELDESLRLKLARTRHRARISFRSENPYFILAMSRSYLPPKTYMVVPTKFSNKYFNEYQGDAVLIVEDGRRWHVKFSYQTPYKRSRVKLYKGWKKFALENCLEVGDVCSFELIKGINTTFKVAIFRVADDGSKLD